MPRFAGAADMKPFILICLLICGTSSGLSRHSWTGVGRVVAVGDVHGDFRRFVEVLRHANLIDNEKNWSGGKSRLVQTGDLLDRGPDSRAVMDLLMRLEKQAPLQGGAVHCLIGNHEAMNLTGDYRYVSEGEAASHGGMKQLARNMGPRGRYGGWILEHNAVVRINNAVFLHGGISQPFSEASIPRLNEMVSKELRQGDGSTGVLGGDGPLWYRGLTGDRSSSVERGLRRFLQGAGADFAVTGHTVTEQGIETRFAGRVVMIDTGLSGQYGGPGMYIVLDDRGFKAVDPGRAEWR